MSSLVLLGGRGPRPPKNFGLGKRRQNAPSTHCLRIAQGPKSVVVLLPRGVPKPEVNRLPIHHHICADVLRGRAAAVRYETEGEIPCTTYSTVLYVSPIGRFKLETLTFGNSNESLSWVRWRDSEKETSVAEIIPMKRARRQHTIRKKSTKLLTRCERISALVSNSKTPPDAKSFCNCRLMSVTNFRHTITSATDLVTS